MKVTKTGTLHHGNKGGNNAVATFPSITVIDSAIIMVAYRVGSTKDGEDEVIKVRKSSDGGLTWTDPETPFSAAMVNGSRGSLKIVYITPIETGHLIAAAMWVDRETRPGKPLFNPETEGCLPMAILLADSYDNGETWTPWREVPTLAELGPPSLTNPIVRFADGTLALSIETNKDYDDANPWKQRVVYLYSKDFGRTWSAPWTVSEDPTRRLFYWDQRAGVTADGRLVTYSWTYDRQTKRYLNIHRNTSRDNGLTWAGFEDLGFADQASHPAFFSNGRVVLASVDRFGSASIRVHLANGYDEPFDLENAITLYRNNQESGGIRSGGELLDEMSRWSFGLPYAEALPNGKVLVVYYAGTPDCMSCHWAMLEV